MSDKIYTDFVDWLGKSWFGVPDSEFAIETIKATYSEKEAEFLTGFPYRLTALSQIAEMNAMTPTKIQPILDELARKGLIWRSEKRDEVAYSLNDLFFVIMRSKFWPGKQSEELTKIASSTNKYYYNGLFEDFNQMSLGGLRTVSIHQTIEDTREIRPYEDIVTLLDQFEYYTVSDCPCRQRKKLDPDYEESNKPSEVCLHFDDLGKYIVQSGMGREITKEETEAILLKSAKAGLVHGVSNWEQKPDTI